MKNIKYKFVLWIIRKLIKSTGEKRSLRVWYNQTFLPYELRTVGGYEVEYLMERGLKELEVPNEKWEEIVDNEAGSFYDEIIEVSNANPEKSSDVLRYIGIDYLYESYYGFL